MNERRKPQPPGKRPTGGPSGARAPGAPSPSARAGARAVPARPRLEPAAWRIEQVESALASILTWEYPADASLSHWLRSHPKLGARDRAEVSEAVYDVLRHLRRYRQYAETGGGRSTRRLAILGLAGTRGQAVLEPVLAPEERQWLERVLAIDTATLPRAVRASLPDWLDERLGRLPGPEPLLQALNQSADLDLRVNPMKADRDEMLAALRKGLAPQHDPRPTPYSPWGIRVSGRPTLSRWPQFEHGLIEVQDEGSQLLAALVAPKRGEMVIDFCAGAGGKTLLLGALMRSSGRLYAFDVSAARLARAKPRLARSGLSNVVPVAIDSENDVRVKRLAGKAQRVLVDAPCSGVGTLRRNPDLKWRQSVQSVYELCALQRRILDSAARCVAPGGRLVYATCSLLAEENEEQVQAFLARNKAFRLLDAREILAARCETPAIEGPYLQLRPDVHGTDGFFAAVFERLKDAGVQDPPARADETGAAQALAPAPAAHAAPAGPRAPASDSALPTPPVPAAPDAAPGTTPR
ncbi:RsmB/NOP family class I SAM-dependent RNA methyltransferase [Orrella sp. JC864]|uniref:RsmB/NOP family class I SAM-dependent RNA methyltransferase n=1 Tax=Orrella sp. JC864 TaxID=3120298 RepID=UPI003009E3B2